MKKVWVLFVCVLLGWFLIKVSTPFTASYSAIAFAATEDEMYESLDEQLNSLDMEEYEKVLHALTEQGLLPNIAFKDLVLGLLQGDGLTTETPAEFFSAIFQNLWNTVKPIIVLFVVLGILLGVYKYFSAGRKDLEKVVYFSIYTAVVFIVVYVVKSAIQTTTLAIDSMHKQMDALFPILLTVLTATGAVKSAGVYQPLAYVLSQGVASIFSKVLLPLGFMVFVLCIVQSLSSEIKVGKIKSFMSSLLKWGIGTTCSIFLSVLTMKGVVVSASDGMSVKLAKYSIKNYVPVLGGYVSDGFEIVRASSVLLKNAVGVGGIFIVLQSVAVPLLSLMFFQLLFKFLAGILEPVSDGNLCNFFEEISKCMKYFFALVFGVAIMYIFSTAMVIFTANGVV